MCADPRSPVWRRRDTERRLTHDADVWVSSASPDGTPCLVPLSFDWDGRSLLLATSADSPTGRNLAASGRARLGLGRTRDVTMIDGDVEMLAQLPPETADRFAVRTGFDPRVEDATYRWFRITPTRIRAWLEADELHAR